MPNQMMIGAVRLSSRLSAVHAEAVRRCSGFGACGIGYVVPNDKVPHPRLGVVTVNFGARFGGKQEFATELLELVNPPAPPPTLQKAQAKEPRKTDGKRQQARQNAGGKKPDALPNVAADGEKPKAKPTTRRKRIRHAFREAKTLREGIDAALMIIATEEAKAA